MPLKFHLSNFATLIMLLKCNHFYACKAGARLACIVTVLLSVKYLFHISCYQAIFCNIPNEVIIVSLFKVQKGNVINFTNYVSVVNYYTVTESHIVS